MTAADTFKVTTRHGADRVILELDGELDLLNAPILESALEQSASDPTGTLVIDLSNVSFIDSTGLRLLFSARNEARERGCAFAVTPGSQQVQRLLSITRLGEHLRTIGTPDEALA